MGEGSGFDRNAGVGKEGKRDGFPLGLGNEFPFEPERNPVGSEKRQETSTGDTVPAHVFATRTDRAEGTLPSALALTVQENAPFEADVPALRLLPRAQERRNSPRELFPGRGGRPRSGFDLTSRLTREGAQHERSTMAMELVSRVNELKRALDEAKEKLSEKKETLQERIEALERTRERAKEVEKDAETKLETACRTEIRVTKETILAKVVRDEWARLKRESEEFEDRKRRKWKDAFLEIPTAFARECRKFQEDQAQADYLEMRRQADSEFMRITCDMRRINKEIEARKETIAQREQETLSLEKDVCEQAATNESKRTKVSLLANELRRLQEAIQRISEDGRVFDFQGKESSIRKMEDEASAHQKAVQQLHKQIQSYRAMEERLKARVAASEAEVLEHANAAHRLRTIHLPEEHRQDASTIQKERHVASRPLTSMRTFGVRKRGKQKKKDSDVDSQENRRPVKPPLAFVSAAMDPFGGMRH